MRHLYKQSVFCVSNFVRLVYQKSFLLILTLLTLTSCDSEVYVLDEKLEKEVFSGETNQWIEFKRSLMDEFIAFQNVESQAEFKELVVQLNNSLDSAFLNTGFLFAPMMRAQILSIHDEVMPKIGEVMNLRREVQKKASELNEEEANELRDLAKELDEANTLMMVWMRGWSEKSAEYMAMENGAKEQIAYLMEEMKKVQEVKEAINSSIAKAKEALK